MICTFGLSFLCGTIDQLCDANMGEKIDLYPEFIHFQWSFRVPLPRVLTPLSFTSTHGRVGRTSWVLLLPCMSVLPFFLGTIQNEHVGSRLCEWRSLHVSATFSKWPPCFRGREDQLDSPSHKVRCHLLFSLNASTHTPSDPNDVTLKRASGQGWRRWEVGGF